MPLPKSRYEIKHYKGAKVMKNCHVQLDKRYYSVPYRYIGKKVKIIYTISHVSIFHAHERIAYHKRGLRPYAYTTQNEHIPSAHRFVSEWSPEKFISWADRVDPVVRGYIENILGQKSYPEQAYRSCVGILSFEKKLGKDRLVNAVKRATYYGAYNYRTIKKILEGSLDMLDQETGDNYQNRLPVHENIRGADNYR